MITLKSTNEQIKRLEEAIEKQKQYIMHISEAIEKYGEKSIIGRDYSDALREWGGPDPRMTNGYKPDETKYNMSGKFLDRKDFTEHSSYRFQSYGDIVSYRIRHEKELAGYEWQLQRFIEQREHHLESIKETGYDLLGYDENGFDKDGYDELGLSKNGEIKRLPKSQIPYYIVAKDALMNWNGLTEEQADKIIEESSFEEIEGQIGARNSITNAVYSIGQSLKSGDKSTEHLLDRVLGIDDSFDALGLWTKMLDSGDTTYASQSYLSYKRNRQAMLVLDAMEAVHNGWVKDNAGQFFGKKADQRKQYQYLPIELIGWKEAKSDLLFIKPIVEFIGGECIEEDIKSLWEKKASRLVNNFTRVAGYSPIDMEGLGEGIQKLNYEPWTPEIKAAMSDSKFVSETLLPQVREKGFIQDSSLMNRLESEKIFLDEKSQIDELETLKQEKEKLQQQAKTITDAEHLIDQRENSGQSIDE